MKYLTVFFLFFLLCFSAHCQNGVNAALLSSTFTESKDTHTHPRKFLSLKDKSFVAKVNPLLYVGAGLMYFYQNVISEQIQADCGYQMSCSEFTKKSIEKKGIVKGTLKGLNQLYSCFPGSIYERSEYLINSDGKINNVLDEEN
ncbi:MAG: membrane protein insertion efficiency factor YidD [Bacteroidota bacterium]|nr:membrane protein insertion efficiency factor YidD [Bacteroidota bacterium]